MPSASPSPVKRPSMTQPTSSTHSLSSSGKQVSAIHKVHRPHVVSRHSRNVSHGKNLSKLNKVHSSADVADAKNHQRKKSGTSDGTPVQSPKSPGLPKRNSSHVSLPKNSSHGNLRKNQSATVLGRITSQTGLKRLGLPPTRKPKDDNKKTGFFELGDQSSAEEEEAEWEDSNTLSPEFTRNNSKASTPARVETPNGERPPAKPPSHSRLHQEKTSSPPSPSVKMNRSLPDLGRDDTASSQIAHDPSLLHQNGRASRAPPAMSTVSAIGGLMRSESSKSFTHINHSEAGSSNATPGTTLPEGSSSVERPVSHFLNMTPGSTENRLVDDGSDEDPANFMSNYKPLASESPEKQRGLPKSRFASIPSRTQQKLELERRETMRAGRGPTTPPTSSIGLSIGSSLSLHNRNGSRGRNRSLADEMKAQKVDYETGIKQLTVVRRFHNPITEGLNRLKAASALPADAGATTPGQAKTRPQSRRGMASTTANGMAKEGVSRSAEDKKPSPLASRPNSRGRGAEYISKDREVMMILGLRPHRGVRTEEMKRRVFRLRKL